MKPQGKILTILIILIVVTIAVLSLTQEQEDAQQDPIIIGAILPLSGPASEIGNAHLTGLKWKLDELKEKGINIELFVEDSQTNPNQAVTAIRKLIDVNEIDAVFVSLSSDSLAIKPITEERGVFMLSNATHPQLLVDSNYIIRHSFLAENDAQAIAKHISSRGIRSVGLMYQQDEWGNAYNKELEKIFAKTGINFYSEQINHRSADFRTQIGKVISKGSPDAFVFVAIGPASGLLIKQTRELGYQGDIYSSPGLVVTSDGITTAGKFAEGTYYSTFEENQEFSSDYEEKFGVKPPLIAFWQYTDAELLLHAINRTNSKNAGDLVRFIKNMGEFNGTYETIKITEDGNAIIPTNIKIWK